MVKPKGIRKPGLYKRLELGYTGINVDLLSTISTDINQIENAVEVNQGIEIINAISNAVGVAVT